MRVVGGLRLGDLILEVGGRRLLLDCGLIQGGAAHSERNREPFPFDAAGIDALILSHAHIDHCGRLPLLHKRGFDAQAVAQLRAMLQQASSKERTRLEGLIKELLGQ